MDKKDSYTPNANMHMQQSQKIPKPRPQSWQTAIIMLSPYSSIFLAALDTTIITAALPTISEHF